MRRVLSRWWLIGAILYTVSTLLLTQSLRGYAPASGFAVNETVKAKQSSTPEEVILPLFPPPAPSAARRTQWVQAARYMAVVRARPSAAAPVLFAATAGRPLRLVAREAGFARVQDLGSGQLGWIEARSLAPFLGGYRQREVPPPLVVAESVEPTGTPQAAPEGSSAAMADAEPKRPRRAAFPPTRTASAVPLAGLGNRIFARNRERPQRVADRRHPGGFASIMQRAFRGL